MIDMARRFLKYREKLSTLLCHAVACEEKNREEAFKIIEQWKKGKVTYGRALEKISTLRKETYSIIHFANL